MCISLTCSPKTNRRKNPVIIATMNFRHVYCLHKVLLLFSLLKIHCRSRISHTCLKSFPIKKIARAWDENLCQNLKQKMALHWILWNCSRLGISNVLSNNCNISRAILTADTCCLPKRSMSLLDWIPVFII